VRPCGLPSGGRAGGKGGVHKKGRYRSGQKDNRRRRIPSEEEVFDAFVSTFAEEFGIRIDWGSLTSEEEKLLEERKDYFRSEEWIYSVRKAPDSSETLYGIYRCPGGTFRVCAKVDREGKILQQITLNGDLFLHPRRLLYDLEAYLKHTPVAQVEERVRSFFAERPFESVDLKVDDFVEAVLFPLRKLEAGDLGIEKKTE